MSRLLGETFGFVKKGLQPNTSKLLRINITDTLGKEFTNSGTFRSDHEGKLNISEKSFQALIATASNPKQAAFVINEFDHYTIDVTSDDGAVDDRIVIHSGIGNTIAKEEWRGEIVGNLFYPTTSTKNKAIVHINGGVPLLQDGRLV